MDPLRRAYRYCEWISYRHYENFPVASRLLPKEVRPHVAAVYAFARSADDFADEARYEGRSLELLQQWRAALWNSAPPSTGSGRAGIGSVRAELVEARTADHPIFLALSDTIRKYDLPVQLLDDLLTAFLMDGTKRRYADWQELMTYCRYSANPVGRLVLLLFGIRDEELHARSDDLCTALQLANHWQDLAIDLTRDILYIPQSLMNEYRVTESDLKEKLGKSRPEAGAAEQASRRPSGHGSPGTLNSGESEAESEAGRLGGGGRAVLSSSPRLVGRQGDESFRSLMRELVNRARALFDSGEPLVRHLKGGLRLEIKLTLLGGRSILDRIESSGYDVFNHRPVFSTFDKINLLARSIFSGGEVAC